MRLRRRIISFRNFRIGILIWKMYACVGRGLGYVQRCTYLEFVQHGIVWDCMYSMFKFLHSRNNVNYLIWVS
jgi:hypothetical protein